MANKKTSTAEKFIDEHKYLYQDTRIGGLVLMMKAVKDESFEKLKSDVDAYLKKNQISEAEKAIDAFKLLHQDDRIDDLVRNIKDAKQKDVRQKITQTLQVLPKTKNLNKI